MIFRLSQTEMFIFTFIQTRVLVFTDNTYCCKFADYNFSEAFTLQTIIVRMLILIPAWTIAPKIETKTFTS